MIHSLLKRLLEDMKPRNREAWISTVIHAAVNVWRVTARP
jgi:hypothetical protein